MLIHTTYRPSVVAADFAIVGEDPIVVIALEQTRRCTGVASLSFNGGRHLGNATPGDLPSICPCSSVIQSWVSWHRPHIGTEAIFALGVNRLRGDGPANAPGRAQQFRATCFVRNRREKHGHPDESHGRRSTAKILLPWQVEGAAIQGELSSHLLQHHEDVGVEFDNPR